MTIQDYEQIRQKAVEIQNLFNNLRIAESDLNLAKQYLDCYGQEDKDLTLTIRINKKHKNLKNLVNLSALNVTNLAFNNDIIREILQKLVDEKQQKVDEEMEIMRNYMKGASL
jgi:nitrogenase molybdenum-iron protein alpha/beta subunit